jgi:hypothetical protein
MSFEIADLLLLMAWSEARSTRLDISLDHWCHQEVLTLHDTSPARRRWTLWRTQAGVFVRPETDRTRQYLSVADAIEDIAPQPSDIHTHINAASWPSLETCVH